MARRIRIRTAGLYVRDGQVLLVKHQRDGRQYYLLPGGGQEPGESMQKALEREWREELNVQIKVGEFLFMGEVLPDPRLKKAQVVQIVFRISSLEGEIRIRPEGPLFGYDWVSLGNIKTSQIFPACQEQILAVGEGRNPEPYCQYVWVK
ncbi:MAG: NUDIX domain-containing protein [Leptospiraceae bacterium]|nr:NUDIX domain-containing protein [Leptospiraceae bacterium]